MKIGLYTAVKVKMFPISRECFRSLSFPGRFVKNQNTLLFTLYLDYDCVNFCIFVTVNIGDNINVIRIKVVVILLNIAHLLRFLFDNFQLQKNKEIAREKKLQEFFFLFAHVVKSLSFMEVNMNAKSLFSHALRV